ncbi:universal stress protein [Roseomonas sp. KE2513]|uniref:universal stress protein n=1 Tax=Roseomonas sp. KE2513 TaxID=2479202 RepID=UPI0018E05C00|nr:universal stress protein [Roseomonas sp. KE2513]MBI0537395.1 universal stress protein [Roseomonas sp. KE2513]
MADVILVVLVSPLAADQLLSAAERLAVLTGGARVNVLAVRTPPGYSGLTAEANFGEMLTSPITLEDERMAALEAAYRRWAAGTAEAPLKAHWSSIEGLADPVVNEGRRADFLVVARPDRGDHEPTRRAFRAALFKTERPVLVVPAGEETTFGRRVAIAWKDDSRAAKAVLPALRCLGNAEQVHVLAGVRQDAAQPAVPQILLDHGVEADLHVLPIGPGVFGQSLLAKAHELGADLLVMGAYAHSPLREAVLGGVTRYILAHANMPVLMRH